MIKTGILNPQINSLISRVRHTNTLVIADRGFPFWPDIETVDISLVDDVPTVCRFCKRSGPTSSSAEHGWRGNSSSRTALRPVRHLPRLYAALN